ncbi:MAG: hypothetical protein SGJ17_07055 [Hyphomicrobiales bacterium]|nr:hypothetical protein [Hyphomicrobiales bacterium]
MSFILRLLGLTLLACALAALAYDGTRTLANGDLATSSLRQLGSALAASALENLDALGNKTVPYAWTAFVNPLLLMPAWLTMGFLGSLLYLAGHRSKPREIVADF